MTIAKVLIDLKDETINVLYPSEAIYVDALDGIFG